MASPTPNSPASGDAGEAMDTSPNNPAATQFEVRFDTDEPNPGPSTMPEDQDEETQLASLAAGIRDQDDLERSIGRQADALLLEQAEERDKKRLEKTQNHKDRLQGQIRKLEQKLTEFGNSVTKNKYRAEIQKYAAESEALDADLGQIRARMEERQRQKDDAGAEAEGGEGGAEGSKRLPGESQREFLIRTGKITPFSKVGQQLLRTSTSLGDVLLDAEEDGNERAGEGEEAMDDELAQAGPVSHRDLLAPGFDEVPSSGVATPATNVESDAEMARRLQEEEFADSGRPGKRRRLQTRRHARAVSIDSSAQEDSDAYMPDAQETARHSESEDVDVDDDEEVIATTPGIKRKSKAKGRRKVTMASGTEEEQEEDLAGIDDGDESVYQTRLRDWIRRRKTAREKIKQRQEPAPDQDQLEEVADENKDEWQQPHPTRTDAAFSGGLRIPGDIYPSLFSYQQTGVQWLWELYSQQVGGIIGDEMGLGKTIQIISFLAGLHYSGLLTKPVVVVCPATVMKQWVNEFHRWWPPLRVSILHTSGSGMLDVKREARIEDDLEFEDYGRDKTRSKGYKAAKRIVDKVVRDGHVLVTTYSGLQTYAELLIPTDWEYAVLDEGHKIRNPNTAITIYCKELRTHNRVILSGTPMQNNLTELWSLFDFVFPMRLGTLVNFRNQFETPIKMGGYANASNLQVETAMKCAETLKDTISPYLLQRFKVDVAADLPKKSERVLFCKLTMLQRNAYEWFLDSEEMKSIMAGKRQALYGVDILRKICNHPDLVDHKNLSRKGGYAYGAGTKSGKMQVVKALLEMWKKRGHKTLLFAQHRIMLDILERFVKGMEGFRYRRMDGSTNIKDRQDLVDEFNRDPTIHVFLLTTKVGGLGVNLTGADRVIIYDPDWNPSTDVQARERAWRLGQKREVEIYRLMTAGTIEEKIYHRQIFKQFLTNKILRDPKQRQTFQLKDLHDLFTLGEALPEGETETGRVFEGSEVQFARSAGKGNGKGKEREGLPTPPEEGEVREEERKDMRNILGISRQEDFRAEAEEDNDTAAAADGGDGGVAAKTKDDRILTSLFAKSGVHSALEHDAIVGLNGRKTTRADPEMIAREARKVAAAAAEELRRAGEVAKSLPAGVPTWTGTVGSAGRPASPPPARRGGMSSRGGRGGARGGGGPSSAEVLANLSARAPASVASPSTSTSSPRNASRRADKEPKGKDFLVLIRDFLVAQGGQAYTQMLIDHFNRFCKTEQRTMEFREMLKVIAVLEKGGRGRGMWRLREEFRPENA